MFKNMILCLICYLAISSNLVASDVSITVYNRDFGLVRDIRQLDLKEGVQDISITEIPSRIDPTSLYFKPQGLEDSFTILEQNYEYDLVGTSKLLNKYIDHNIKIMTRQEAGVFSGRLLSVDNKSVLISSKDGNIHSVNREEILNLEFPSLPEGLITRPTLLLKVYAEKPITETVEVLYLTRGISWETDYVAVVDQEDTGLTLEGWVTIDNTSGGEYNDAKLKLVAGDINRAKRGGEEVVAFAKAGMPRSEFEEREFFEYHLYSLPRRTTIKQNEIKQISLFPLAKTTVTKVYEFDHFVNKEKVMVKIHFVNSDSAGLGLPLPRGRVRVYKEDIDRALQFIGEDWIDHTPQDESIELFLGLAFDLVAERIKKNHDRISENVTVDDYQVKFRNHKTEKVEINVIEHFQADWFIKKCNCEYTKRDASTAEFKIEVSPGEEKSIEYTVKTYW